MFGASLACIALQRAILEQVLKTEYRAFGNSLEEQLGTMRNRQIDAGVLRSMERLRQHGNVVLHGELGRLAVDEVDALAREAFVTLRWLIEHAPVRR